MKLYEMIIDDGTEVFKAIRPAKDLKSLKTQYGGNGEIIRIKDVTEYWTNNGLVFSDSGIDFLVKVLQQAQYGKTEIEMITALIKTLG